MFFPCKAFLRDTLFTNLHKHLSINYWHLFDIPKIREKTKENARFSTITFEPALKHLLKRYFVYLRSFCYVFFRKMFKGIVVNHVHVTNNIWVIIKMIFEIVPNNLNLILFESSFMPECISCPPRSQIWLASLILSPTKNQHSSLTLVKQSII